MGRHVDRNAGSTEGKLIGGVTGKGWRPGVSGNPGGRRPLPALLRERLDALVPEAVDIIWTLAKTAESESVRLAASEYILNRRLGKPTEVTKIDATEGMEPPTIVIRTLPIGERGEPGAQ